MRPSLGKDNAKTCLVLLKREKPEILDLSDGSGLRATEFRFRFPLMGLKIEVSSVVVMSWILSGDVCRFPLLGEVRGAFFADCSWSYFVVFDVDTTVL